LEKLRNGFASFSAVPKVKAHGANLSGKRTKLQLSAKARHSRAPELCVDLKKANCAQRHGSLFCMGANNRFALRRQGKGRMEYGTVF
jgi:hypothetical protein